MINFFLNQHQGLTGQKRKLIQKKFLYRRKYNPFHLDCQYTKKKLCYCKKNPLAYLTQGQKVELWTKSYMKPHQFYTRKQLTLNNDKQGNVQPSKHMDEYRLSMKNRQNEQTPKQHNDEKQIAQVGRQFNICIEKIRALSKDEVVKFIQEHSKKYRRAIIQTADVSNMLNQY